MKLRPFFHFYGGKWRAAPHYPLPQHNLLIEPFAGSAGYSLRYPHHQVVLVEKDPVIAATWRYLMGVSPSEVLKLPDLEPGQAVSDLTHLPQEARYLIGWWIQSGRRSPHERPSARALTRPNSFWGETIRERIAKQIEAIRHWWLIEGDYSEAPEFAPATWFIDPPYQDKGRAYKYGSNLLDFTQLATWCRSRSGQVIVCENVGATWLPFRFFRKCSANKSNAGRAVSKEAVWVREA